MELYMLFSKKKHAFSPVLKLKTLFIRSDKINCFMMVAYSSEWCGS